MLKWLIKKILLNLLSDDYDVQMKVTRVANPDLANEIEKPLYPHRPPLGRCGEWWHGGMSKASYIARNEK